MDLLKFLRHQRTKSEQTERLVEARLAEAQELFFSLANEFALACEETEEPVDLCIHIPRQHDLTDGISLSLQNGDELHFNTLGMTCSLFPFETTKDVFGEYVRGLLDGQYRVLSWNRNGSSTPYRAYLQRPAQATGWETVFRYDRAFWLIDCLRTNTSPIAQYLRNDPVGF